MKMSEKYHAERKNIMSENVILSEAKELKG